MAEDNLKCLNKTFYVNNNFTKWVSLFQIKGKWGIKKTLKTVFLWTFSSFSFSDFWDYSFIVFDTLVSLQNDEFSRKIFPFFQTIAHLSRVSFDVGTNWKEILWTSQTKSLTFVKAIRIFPK